MKVIESSGATREEAIQNGLEKPGVELDAIERIDVIDEGSKGFLGLGKREVRVRLSLDPTLSREQKGRDQGGSGQERRQSGQQRAKNRPNRGEAQARGNTRPREQSRKDGRKKEEGRENTASQGRQGGQNRGGSKRNRRPDQEHNRDRNRQNRENTPQQTTRQKSNADSGYHKAAPITGKSASNVSEESMEAQRLADQFENIDLNAAVNTSAPPPPVNAREEDTIEPITDEQGNEASALLQEIINHMELSAQVSFTRAKDGSARLAVESEKDGGILIGKRGVTLEAMQYLINRMVPQNGGNETMERIVVDVGDYVDRRHAMLRDMALSMAAKAKSSRRNVRLKPLSPQERRIIHLTLENDPEVRTYSTGDSLFRSIVINPLEEKRPGRNRQGRNTERRNDRNGAAPASAAE